MLFRKSFPFAVFFGLLSSVVAQDQVSHVWTRSIPVISSNGTVQVRGVAFDPSGAVIVAGNFSFTADMDPGSEVDARVSSGSADIFVSKFSHRGVRLWTKTVGGTASDVPLGLAVDHEGNICISGWFDESVDFDPSEEGVDIHSSVGGTDVFTSKYSSDGDYLWTKTVGNSAVDFFGENYSSGVVFDSAGNVIVVGNFLGDIDFDPSEEGVDIHSLGLAAKGMKISFISKYSSDGDYLWTKSFQRLSGGSSRATQVVTDSQNNIVLGGSFRGSIDFDPSELGEDLHIASFEHGDDAFVCKISSEGEFLWARSFGGNVADVARDVAVDPMGHIFVVGFYGLEVDFDPSELGVDLESANGSSDCFISKFTPQGDFEWGHRFGGNSSELPYSAITDSVGSIIVAGSFGNSVDFNPNQGGDVHVAPSGGFHLTKLDSLGNYEWTHTYLSNQGTLESVDRNATNQIVYGGSFGGSAAVDFDLSSECSDLRSSTFPTRSDGFVSTFLDGPNSIQSADPANNSIDARQPSDLNGTQQFGTQQIALDFAGSVSCVGAGEFSIQEESGDGVVPAVSGLLVNGEFGVTLTLNPPIEPGAWTIITHDPSGSSVRLGYLPGDVNGDKTSSPVDILSLINSLNGVIPRPLHSTDMDRSGIANPADILRLIDLLNGAGAFDPWNGVSLP